GTAADELLLLAGSLEQGSEHPLAAAIAKGAAERGLALTAATDFQSITGKGVQGRVNGRTVSVGNRKLLEESGASVEGLLEVAESARREGQTVMFVAIDGKTAGILGVADPIKQTTLEVIEELRADGLQIVMLTGDSRTTALAVASK